jgi:nucleotide-binding universal stress UspA family protein
MSAETVGIFPLKKILLAVDGSENSLRAADAAISLAKERNSELLILNVIAPLVSVVAPVGAGSYPVNYGDYYEGQEKSGLELVERMADTARKRGVQKVRNVVERSSSSVVETIVNSSRDEKVDLIVIGTRGLGGFRRFVLGSVSSGVVSHAHCNVLIVR